MLPPMNTGWLVSAKAAGRSGLPAPTRASRPSDARTCGDHGAGGWAMLTDNGYRARLRSLLAFALVQRKAHFGARLQLAEFAIDDAVAVKIDLLSVAGGTDEPVAVFGKIRSTLPC